MIDVLSIVHAMDQISALVNKPAVSLQDQTCVHQHHKQADCDRCVAACPTHAFDLAEGQVTLSADRCVRCGYCIHACPTGAITGSTEFDKLLQSIKQNMDKPHVELACAYRPTPEAMVDSKAGMFITPRCLAALSIANYVELANQGIIHLTVRGDACGECPIGRLIEQIQQTAQAAQPLTADQPTMAINVITDAPTGGKPVKAAHDANRPTMSRRGLFQMLTQGLQAEEPPATIDVSNLPPERQRLLKALDARPGETVAWAPALKVEGNCTACKICPQICPTNALEIDKEQMTFQLRFNAARCTGCNLCTVACPERVLYFDPEPMPALEATLTAGELRDCKRCKTVFSGESDLCPACAFRRKNPFGSRMLDR